MTGYLDLPNRLFQKRARLTRSLSAPALFPDAQKPQELDLITPPSSSLPPPHLPPSNRPAAPTHQPPSPAQATLSLPPQEPSLPREPSSRPHQRWSDAPILDYRVVRDPRRGVGDAAGRKSEEGRRGEERKSQKTKNGSSEESSKKRTRESVKKCDIRLTALIASYGASHPDTSRMILLDWKRWKRRTSRTRKRTPSTRRKCRWRMKRE